MVELTFDLENNEEPPTVAQKLYRYYQFDCLNSVVYLLRKNLDMLDKIYPDMSTEELDKASKIVKVEILTSFCQLAESLAAMAIAFKRSYDSEIQETLGLYEKLVCYTLGEIGDFYENVGWRDHGYFAKILGYPPLDLQVQSTREAFLLSCENVKEKFTEISEYYKELRLLFNAYKHGYRILFETNNDTHDDIILFVTDEFKQKITIINIKTIDKIVGLCGNCYDIIHTIMLQHHRRSDHEKRGGGHEAIEYNLLLKGNQRGSEKNNLQLYYPNRGERLFQEKEEGDKIFNEVQGELGIEQKGKIIAIDIDSRKIIAQDFDMKKVIDDVHKSESSGRIHIRRVSTDGSTHLEIY